VHPPDIDSSSGCRTAVADGSKRYHPAQGQHGESNMNTIRLLTAASAMACASLCWAGSPQLAEFGRNVPGFYAPGPARFAVADFDRDGREDIVVPAVSGTALFQVFGPGAGGIVSKQAVFVPDAALASVLVASIAGQPQLVTVSQAGRVRRFAGWPLVEVHAFDIVGEPIVSAAVADVDADGVLDLVTSTAYGYSTLQAHGLLDGAAHWTLPDRGGPDLLIGQFDADPALEIVVAGTPGRVIDGATRATDWSYKDGFGIYVASGHFQAAGGKQFVASNYYGSIIGFQSAPWSPIWDIPTTSYVSALAVSDLDGDGIDDIIEGGGSWGEVNIIDGATRTVRLSIPYEGYETTAIAAWDHDGDGHSDVAFGPRETYWTDSPLFHFADADNGNILWTLPGDQPPTYQRLTVGRTAAGYTLVYPFGTGSHGGGWAQINAVYGTAQWRTPPTSDASSPFYMEAKDTAYTHGGTQLVLAGTAWSSARFIGLDASSHAVRWILDEQSDPSLDGFDILSMTTLDGGAYSTIAACVQSYEGKRLLLVDASTGTLTWTSVPMGGNYACDVMTGRFAAGGNPLVVAVLESSLRAYDATTHLLVWSLPGAIDGASLIEQGVAGREFVVFEGSQLRFHDAASRELLRTFDLGVPIEAVRQMRGDIHGLVVAADGRLLVVDGTNGAVLLTTRYLGSRLGAGNRIATADLGDGYTLIGVGSDGGVFRYRLYTGDGIFADGFESLVD
jgi:hypothetical protein